jgi:hypothetical protein
MIYKYYSLDSIAIFVLIFNRLGFLSSCLISATDDLVKLHRDGAEHKKDGL